MKIDRPDKARKRGEITEQNTSDNMLERCSNMKPVPPPKPDNGDSNGGAEGEE